MGRGKSWSRDESKAVAKAWKVASALPEFSSTRDHNSKRFAAHLYQCFIKLTPNHADPASLDGRWTFRSQTAVKTQFDAIADDILKFNLVLLAVRDSILPPVSAHPPDPRLLRAAIAVHLGAAPRHHIDLDAVDTIESDWKLFEAWTILKTCPRFAPNPAPSDLSSFPENANTSNNNNNNTNTNNNNNNNNTTTNNNNNNNNNNNPPPSSSVPHTPTKSLPSGNTPMRTLASAALSMPHVPAVPSHPSPSSSRSRSRSPSPNPNPNSTHHPYRPMRTRSRRLRDPAVSAVHFRPVGPPAKPVKRRLTPVPADHLDHNHVDQPDQHDHHSLNDDDQHQLHHNHDNHDDNSPSLPRRRPLPKAPRLSTCNLAASSGAIEMVGHALRSLGDALSEYNAITLFSRPDMQGRQDQKLFFNTLAEKHVLKAKRDRDQLAAEVQRVREGSDKSNT